ncbi:MAG TPA: NAD-dependent epimerase/dehydratase family protein [Nitrososphaerales archaeon]|nr:NAD-dependent epimerase/dehydratase family protein [Nitrososphaerales archaeon]
MTGGAGFIGSHLADRLLEEGYSVTAIDNLSQGTTENLAHLGNNHNFRFLEGDLKDAPWVQESLAGHDVVFHMAAHANIRTSLVDHMADLQNNLIGTMNILEAMVKNKVRDLVFASTSALYGEASLRPTPETFMPVQTSLYGASKLACEAYAEAYTEFADVRFWAYRFSNVIGERCRRGVVWDFVNKLRINPRELEILGDGKQSKEYIHVSDCVEGIMTGYAKSNGKSNIFNLAVEDNKTVDQVADIVVAEMGLKEVSRRYSGGPKGWIGDNPVVHLDISKLKGFGWSPKHSAEEAIKETTKWSLGTFQP